MEEDKTSAQEQGKWSDREITAIDEDRFGSQDYADVLAERAATADTPLTIGVFGRWGSGKSSLMRLTREKLTERRIESIWINVWQLSSRAELWNAFLQALFNQVREHMPPLRRWRFNWRLFWQRVRWGVLIKSLLVNSYRVVVAATPILLATLWPDDSLKNAGDLLRFALDPVTGGAASLVLAGWLVIAPAIDAAREKVSLDLDEILEETPYQVQITELQTLQDRFENLVQTWVGVDGRLVVFIDDLDRCTPDKVPEVLEAIKLFTNTPGCVYVLGLDHEIVRKGIRAKYEFEQGEAAEYLEKIVQIPFHLPPLDQNRVMRYVVDQYADVHHICATAPEVFCKGLEPNPRKVKRALNIYRTLWDLAEVRVAAWEMDPVDPELLAKMVVLQSRFSALNRYLRENPYELPKFELYIETGKTEIDEYITEEHITGEYADRYPERAAEFRRKAEENRQKEKNVRQQIDKLVPEDHRPALNQLFAAGEQRFRHVPAGGLVSYIYLTGTAEGISDLMRPSRRERDALLSNDRERVREQVEMILARAANQEEETRLAESYRKRLEKIWDESLAYSEAELDSAGYALAWFEIQGFKGKSRELIFDQRLYELSLIDPGVKGYITGLYEALDEPELASELDIFLSALLSALGVPQLVPIPAGPFLMGTTEQQAQELIADGYKGEWAMQEVPQHTVELSEYQIGKCPLTNQEYQAFIRDSDQAPPRDWDDDQYPEGKGDHPVVYVSWHDAQAYCQWLSQKTGKTYRLPTEAEWEKAARGGSPLPQGEGAGVRVYPWGDEWDPAKCNTKESGPGDTTPVGQYSPESDSPYGCADMAGNVWEWCADWFDEDAYKNREDGVQDPQGPEQGKYRVLRGGSYYNDRTRARAACRFRSSPPSSFGADGGFRVAASSRSIPEGGLSLSPLNSES